MGGKVVGAIGAREAMSRVTSMTLAEDIVIAIMAGRHRQLAMSSGDHSDATKISEPDPRWTALIFVFLVGVVAYVAAFADGHLPLSGPFKAAYLVIVTAGLVWASWRGWRIALRMDDSGVTVRNFLRTYRFGWSEVRRFEDGSCVGGESRLFWALKIVLHDGRHYIATGTMAGDSETVEAIRWAAERHRIRTREMKGRIPPERRTGVAPMS